MRPALLVLVCWLYGLPLARADDGKVLAADHLVHVSADIVVQSRWRVDGRVRAGEAFAVRWPLASGTSLESADVLAERDAEARVKWGRHTALLVFALGLAWGVRALARARRRWQREQRMAYLKQALSAEDRELLGLEDGEES
jgi:hypothetical protein